MTGMTYPKVLQIAQELPQEAQRQLAEALLLHLRSGGAQSAHPSEGDALTPIFGLSPAELQALADAVVAADRQASLQELLEKNRAGALTTEETRKLDSFLAEADQVALLKARALYTMHILEVTGTSS
jgi:hypothetical protein